MLKTLQKGFGSLDSLVKTIRYRASERRGKKYKSEEKRTFEELKASRRVAAGPEERKQIF